VIQILIGISTKILFLGCAVSKKLLRFGFGFTGLVFCTVCRLMHMTLEMTYFRAELVQLIVSRSDSELEVQRYGMKKNTLSVHPIMLQNEL